jgi:hypothetical protein
MESKKINQLATELAPDLSDLTIIGDPTTGISKKITLSQMASLFTGTVEEYANFAAFPLVGVADTIYIALDTNILYRWNTGTSAYVELSPNIVSSLVFNDANGFDGTINLVGSVATLTITTALTTGSVGFIGASGALLQDNANFFWDDTNNRLGLGTNAPTTALDVFGSGIIGRINGTSTNNAYLGFASAGTNKWSVGNVQSDHRFRIFSEANSAELVSVLQTGEFGIGIANPTTKFHIDGAASALIANLDANVSVAKSISFRSDNSNRINLEVSGTESGSNAGADLQIKRFSDAGALIDTALYLQRSTGNISIGGVTLSSWYTGYTAMQLGASASIFGNKTTADTNVTQLANNAYLNTAATNWQYINTDEATRYEQVNGEHNFYSVVSGSAGGNITWGTSKMTINSTGNVGIGTSSPSGKLHLSSTSDTYFVMTGGGTPLTYSWLVDSTNLRLFSGVGATTLLTIASTGAATFTGNIAIQKSAGILLLGNSTTNSYGVVQFLGNASGQGNTLGELDFYNKISGTDVLSGQIEIAHDSSTANSKSYMALRVHNGTSLVTPLYISSGGNVLIGSTSDQGSWKGQVTGNLFVRGSGATSASTGFYLDNSSGATLLYVRNDGLILTGTAAASPYNNTTTSADYVVVGTSGILYRLVASSQRYKENIQEWDGNGLNTILALKPKTFKYKKDYYDKADVDFLGLIAEEVAEVCPYLATYENEDRTGQVENVRYANIVVPLIKAIQEQQAQIEELKTKIK